MGTLNPNLREQALSCEWVLSARKIARRAAGIRQAPNRGVTFAIVLLLIAAARVVSLALAGDDLDSLAKFASEILPNSPRAIMGNAYAIGRQEGPFANGQFTLDEIRIPGTDFAGAYISGVEHLSSSSSLIQIFVPAGVEGIYWAVVTASERLEYECVILHHYTNQLYCLGPSLPEASQINLQIYRIDELDGSQILVFEANYATGVLPPHTPSPQFMAAQAQPPTPTQTPVRSIVPTARRF